MAIPTTTKIGIIMPIKNGIKTNTFAPTFIIGLYPPKNQLVIILTINVMVEIPRIIFISSCIIFWLKPNVIINHQTKFRRAHILQKGLSERDDARTS